MSKASTVKVRAQRDGVYMYVRHRAGTVFEVAAEHADLPWVERVPDGAKSERRRERREPTTLHEMQKRGEIPDKP